MLYSNLRNLFGQDLKYLEPVILIEIKYVNFKTRLHKFFCRVYICLENANKKISKKYVSYDKDFYLSKYKHVMINIKNGVYHNTYQINNYFRNILTLQIYLISILTIL